MTENIENTIYESSATLLLGVTRMHGKLYLTQNSLIFEASTPTTGYYNSGHHTEEIPLDNIAEICLGNRFIFFPAKMIIELKDGKKERFSVSKPGAWIEHIQRVRPIDVIGWLL